MKTMNFIRKEWLVILITILPIFIIGFCWSKLQTRLNVENLTSGEPFEIYLYIGLNIILYPLLLLFPRIIFIRKTLNSESNIFMITRTIIHLTISFLTIIILFSLLGYDPGKDRLMAAIILCFLLITGNYFGNIRQNHFIGIRLPWIIADEKVWRLTHRLFARLLVVSTCLGLIFLSTNLFINPKIKASYFYFGPVALSLIISVIYSYFIHQKNK